MPCIVLCTGCIPYLWGPYTVEQNDPPEILDVSHDDQTAIVLDTDPKAIWVQVVDADSPDVAFSWFRAGDLMAPAGGDVQTWQQIAGIDVVHNSRLTLRRADLTDGDPVRLTINDGETTLSLDWTVEVP